MRNGNSGFWAKKIIGITVCVLAVAALLSYVVMLLWNGVLVDVTGVKIISFWQSAGLLLLSKILFGGFSKGWNKGGGKWNSAMKEKWQHITPEEKEKFKQEWRNKCSMRSRYGQPTDTGKQQAGAE